MMNKKIKRNILIGLIISNLLTNSTFVHAGRLMPLKQDKKETNTVQEEKINKTRKIGIISPNIGRDKTVKDRDILEKDKIKEPTNKETSINKLKIADSNSNYKKKNNFKTPVRKLNRYEQLQIKHLSKYKNKSGPIPPIDMSQTGIRISSYFGSRKAPNQWASTFHRGIDLAAPKGTLVYSPLDGEVIVAKHTGTGGNTIKIRHSEGRESVFMHMSMRSVQVGDKVKQGQIIGTVGNTGNSTGSHLHYEFRHNGIAINPINIIMQ